MERAAAGQDGLGGQRDDLAIREGLFQRLARHIGCSVVAIGGHHHGAVGDQEVHVAGRNRAFVLVQHQARRRDSQYTELTPRRVGHARQIARRGVIDLGVGVVPPPGDGTGHDARRDEAGQVVHVSVCVVVQQAVAQPKHRLGANGGLQRGGRDRLVLVPGRVAVRVQQALAGGQHRPLPVMIQRPALHDEVVPRQRHARMFADLTGDPFVARHVIFPAPAVELERRRRRRSRAEDRPGVAQPDVAELTGHHLDILDALKARPGVRQHLGLADHQLDLFTPRPGQGPHQPLDLVLRLFQRLEPVFGMAGPAHPHGAVRSPLGRNGGGDGSGHRRAGPVWGPTERAGDPRAAPYGPNRPRLQRRALRKEKGRPANGPPFVVSVWLSLRRRSGPRPGSCAAGLGWRTATSWRPDRCPASRNILRPAGWSR